jgi:DnaJ-class molecular chaperone
MKNRETYTKIVTCPRCEGEGCTKKWNDQEREYDQVVCTTCGGLRVLEKIVSVEFKKIEHAGKTEISSTALATQGPGE